MRSALSLALATGPIAALLLALPAHGAPAADPPAADPPAADPSDAPPPPARDAPAAADTAPAAEPGAPASAPAVPDSTWSALSGKRVAIDTEGGPIEGELASSDGENLVVIADDGTVQSVRKADATGVKVTKSEPLTPDAVEPPPKEKAKPRGEPKGEGADEKKDRKSKRKHALLGAFTAHGAGYANWRGQGVSAGHAAYLMDWGIGVNATPGFGLYAMAGGVLGARIEDKTIRANYGHFDLMFAFGGKYYHSMFGAGVALSRLKMPGETQKDAGLSVPFKIFGKLPLPHKLYLGIGLSYEFAIVREWQRVINVIGGQIVFGRW